MIFRSDPVSIDYYKIDKKPALAGFFYVDMAIMNTGMAFVLMNVYTIFKQTVDEQV